MWSLHLPVEPHCLRCCPASLRQAPGRLFALPLTARSGALCKSFRNDPDHGSDNSPKLTGLKSEFVIGFIPESRSDQFRNADRDNFGLVITLARNPHSDFLQLWISAITCTYPTSIMPFFITASRFQSDVEIALLYKDLKLVG